MARVLAFTRDLLFGSQVQGALTLAGHDVELVGAESLLRERLTDADDPAGAGVDVLVVDLTDAELEGASTVRALADSGALGAARTMGFYSHVDTAAREHAQRAGIHLIVARSRMAREGPQLVAGLLAGAQPAGE